MSKGNHHGEQSELLRRLRSAYERGRRLHFSESVLLDLRDEISRAEIEAAATQATAPQFTPFEDTLKQKKASPRAVHRRLCRPVAKHLRPSTA